MSPAVSSNVSVGTSFFRIFSGAAGSSDNKKGAEAIVAGIRCPLAGRISMDLIAIDVTDVPADKTDWTPLQGKAVLVWPDRDKPGWEYAMSAAQAVLTAGAASCDVLLPPDDKPDGWDAADAIGEGFDIQGFIASGPRMCIKPLNTARTQEATVWATDDALALSFTSRYADDWRYCAAWGKWLVWTGSRWQPDETLLSHHLIRSICREAALKVDSHRLAAKLLASGTVGGVDRLGQC